jgi:peptide/nickel transport system substrate-binding protein
MPRTSSRPFLCPAAVLTVVSALLLSACGGGAAPSTSSTSSSKTTASSSLTAESSAGIETLVTTPPAKGDVAEVKWGLEYEPSTLDWMLDYATQENLVVANITESLVRFMPDFSLAPSLAASWKHPDPTTWVFTLRPGVTFSDGTALTPADVVYSLNRNRSAASYWATWLTYVKGVKATGPDEVTVTLSKPDSMFLQMMSMPAGGVGSKAYIEKSGKNYGTAKAFPMGTGPFKVTAWKPGSGITLEPNTGYWDTAHAPKVQKLDFSFVGDQSTRTSALASGQLDGAYLPAYSGVQTLKASSSGKLYRGPSMLQSIVLFTDKKGPFNDPNLRRAWLKATDRTAIAKTVYGGAAVPFPDTFLPPAAWGYGKDIAAKAYAALGGPVVDIPGAQALVKAAGSPTQTIKVAYRANQQDTDMMNILVAAGRQIGLKIKGVALPLSQFTGLIFDEKARLPFDAFLEDRYYSDIADPLELTYEFLAAPEPGFVSYNFDKYANPQVNSLLRKARGTEDDNARAQLIADAQQIMSKDVPVMPLVVPDSLLYMRKDLTGPPASFSYFYYPWARDLGSR